MMKLTPFCLRARLPAAAVNMLSSPVLRWLSLKVIIDQIGKLENGLMTGSCLN